MKDYTLNLDKPRTLRFGFKALRLIRNKFGERNLDSLLQINMDEMPYLAYAGLHHEDKNLTVEQVEDLLDEAIPKDYTVMGLTQIVVDALATQMGVDPKAEASTQKETATVKMPTKTTASTKPPKKKPSPSGSPTPS